MSQKMIEELTQSVALYKRRARVMQDDLAEEVKRHNRLIDALGCFSTTEAFAAARDFARAAVAARALVGAMKDSCDGGMVKTIAADAPELRELLNALSEIPW